MFFLNHTELCSPETRLKSKPDNQLLEAGTNNRGGALQLHRPQFYIFGANCPCATKRCIAPTDPSRYDSSGLELSPGLPCHELPGDPLFCRLHIREMERPASCQSPWLTTQRSTT